MNLRDKFWQRCIVAESGLLRQPGFAIVNGHRITECGPSWLRPIGDLSDALLSAPGSYILKPRFGSNGFCVARIVSHANGTLTVESDCPDTAQFLEDFPSDPVQGGRDWVNAMATLRSRFVDRARVGMSDRVLDQSIVEEEIRQDRVDGSMFEPRIVVQRTKTGFATLGAICKRIDSPVAASVDRDYREEPLEVSLHRFLAGCKVEETRDEILATADRMRAILEPILESSETRVHQFGIDCRLCRDPITGRVEYPFIEFQFGIGRIDWPTLGTSAFAGYRTREELRAQFGPEVG